VAFLTERNEETALTFSFTLQGQLTGTVNMGEGKEHIHYRCQDVELATLFQHS